MFAMTCGQEGVVREDQVMGQESAVVEVQVMPVCCEQNDSRSNGAVQGPSTNAELAQQRSR